MAHPPTSFATLQRIFLGIGFAGLAVSVLMVFKFGYSMSVLHAVALALTSIACAFIFPAAEYLKRHGFQWGARWIQVLGVGFFCLELFAHVGYTIGQRTHSTDEAVVQTVAYEARQEQLRSNRANLEMWRKQLADLKAANAWAATVSADGLRAQLDAADEAIRQEERRGGCGPRCLALKQQKGALENRIAVAEQVQDLSKRIAATQQLVDRYTEVAVETKTGFSPVKAQTDFVSQLYLLATTSEAEKALKPDSVTLTVSQILIGFMLALGMTVLSPAAFYIAFCKSEELAAKFSATSTPAASSSAAQPTTNTVLQPVVVNDNAFAKAIADLQSVQKFADLKAA